MRGGRLHVLRRDEGSVLYAGAITMLAMAMLGLVIIEGAQWFQHRRYLQVRADAAALAGAQDFNACFTPGFTDKSAETLIEQDATKYSGLSASDYNINWQQGTTQGTTLPDGLGFQFADGQWPSPTASSPQYGTLGNECETLLLDVTLAQSPPSMLSLTPFVPTIHARARVELEEIQSISPDLPLMPPDVNPKAVAVTFVNDATGQALQGCTGGLGGCVFSLTKGAAAQGLSPWTGPATITVPADTNVGMRVSVGSQAGSCAGNNTTTTYRCYVYSSTGQASPLGVIRIRGYSTAGTGTPTSPILRGVSASTCSGSPFFSIVSPLDANGNCSAGVKATVDIGGGTPPPNFHVRATINGTNLALTYDPTPPGSWSSNPSDLALPVNGGPYPVTIAWCSGACNLNATGNTWKQLGGGPVQQIFSGNNGVDPADPAGPILVASVLYDSGKPAYTVPGGTAVNLVVGVSLYGGVHLATPCSVGYSVGSPPPPSTTGANYLCASDPPVLLRLVNSSSLSYAVNCGTVPGNPGPSDSFYQQIRYGCANTYSINQADLCPDPTTPPPPYPSCAQTQQGGKVGPAIQALNDRFAPNGVCDANYYPITYYDELTTGNPDPRIVTLLVTDFSAFDQQGSSLVPVTNVAAFYVTGWSGASNCSGINEPPPPGTRTNGTSASIWGHFIKFATLPGKPSGYKCDTTSVTPCVAALVQ